MEGVCARANTNKCLCITPVNMFDMGLVSCHDKSDDKSKTFIKANLFKQLFPLHFGSDTQTQRKRERQKMQFKNGVVLGACHTHDSFAW